MGDRVGLDDGEPVAVAGAVHDVRQVAGGRPDVHLDELRMRRRQEGRVRVGFAQVQVDPGRHDCVKFTQDPAQDRVLADLLQGLVQAGGDRPQPAAQTAGEDDDRMVQGGDWAGHQALLSARTGPVNTDLPGRSPASAMTCWT